MKNFILIGLMFSFATLALSCGKFLDKFGRTENGSTTVSFDLGGRHPGAAVLGGLMIYAVRLEDGEIRKASKYLSSEDASVDWPLPNGNYKFHAVGYSGGVIGNIMYCGSSATHSLSGQSITVPITMDDAGICGTPPFSPSTFAPNNDQPHDLYLGICDSSTGLMSNLGTSLTCNGAGGRPASVTAGSAQLYLLEFNGLSGGVPSINYTNHYLASSCINGTFLGSGPTSTGVKLPYGAPFLVKVQVWSAAGCTGTNYGSVYYWRGFANAETNAYSLFRNGSSGAFESESLQQSRILPNQGGSTNVLFIRENQ